MSMGRRSEDGMTRRQIAVLEGPPAVCCAPVAARGLTDEEADTTAQLFKALADPNRVKIVNRLATSDEPVCGCDLEEPLGLSQPTVSFHLKKLMDAGLLDREKRGIWVYWSLNRDATARLGGVLRFDGKESR
jgi:ArsR family transcriptional regulator, arsenate/arsenite/antimonite-responsive transcriptional repressor